MRQMKKTQFYILRESGQRKLVELEGWNGYIEIKPFLLHTFSFFCLVFCLPPRISPNAYYTTYTLLLYYIPRQFCS